MSPAPASVVAAGGTDGHRPVAGTPCRIAIVAGESSGDLIAADLMLALRERLPQVEFRGVCGARMRAAGAVALADIEELSVMGLVEVLRHLPRLLSLRRRLRRELLAWQPTLYIGVDAPDFNLGLAARLRAAGVRALHYVSPSIWAWRRGRARSIGRQVDEVLCLFPFEPPLYHAHGVAASFVGHPLADRLSPEPDRAAARARLGLDPERPLLAVLPGSRRGEVARLGADFLAAAAAFAAARPQWQVALPTASAACAAQLAALGIASMPIRMLEGRSGELLAAADLALVASGTATLETALVDTPMVVAYRIAPLSHWLVRRFGLLQSRWFSLPNALRLHLGAGTGADTGGGASDGGGAAVAEAGQAPLVPELAQDEVSPQRLAAALLALADDASARAAQRAGFARIRAELRRDASQRVVERVLAHLDHSAVRGGRDAD